MNIIDFKTVLGISILGLFSIKSCDNSDIDSELQLAKTTSEDAGTFKLISRERLDDSVLRSAKASVNLDYESLYDHAYAVHRYSFYGSWTNLDHFYDHQQASTIKHDKHTYNYEGKEFSTISPDIWRLDNNKKAVLYRHYSSSLDDHILSTSSSVSGYTRETSLGMIFLFQEIGTVPLKEFYSSERKKHLYSCRNSEIDGWIPQNDPDFKYAKTIGYVYPGRVDPQKKATTITFTPDPNADDQMTAQYLEGASNIEIQVKVYEGDNIYKLTYSAKTQNGKATLTLPNTYSVICMNAIFTYNGRTHEAQDITAYDYVGKPGAYGAGYDFARYPMCINKKYNGYSVTYEYAFIDIVVGNEPIG